MIKTSEDEGKSALKTALECAYDLLLQKIISNPNDMMGILLFGTVNIYVPRQLTW
jgi:ATP-dependent DNA helicase 2 subunit 1